jgi:HAD superfamily hydrolase (TIGR01509 family)
VSFTAVIFDFDGVIADSEVHANLALAECLTVIGLRTTFDDCLRDYYGYNWEQSRRTIEDKLGRSLPDDFRQMCRDREHQLVGAGPPAVEGVERLLADLKGIHIAIASSSPREFILSLLYHYEIEQYFGNHIYSADSWARGKPFPDIYHATATGLGVEPVDCLVIEDSPVGATAGIAAGMTVVGFCGGGHVVDKAKHGESLKAVGVRCLFSSYAEMSRVELEMVHQKQRKTTP